MRPNPKDANPYPGTPRFFKWVWESDVPVYDPDISIMVEQSDGSWGVLLAAIPIAPGRISIYGFSARSEYEADRPYEDGKWREHRQFPSWGFSQREPEGEWGFTPLDKAIEITADEFERARSDGWPEINS